MKVCLIVDDSEIIRKYTRLIFESLDYRAIDVENPQQAIDRLDGEPPELILVDWRMPGVDSHAFIAQLRKLSLNLRPYIIYVTTEKDVGDIQRALKAGADDFLLKPFNRDIIEMKLHEIRVAA